MSGRDNIGKAWEIAKLLDDGGYSPVDGSNILAMALGIFMEGQPDAHRNLKPLTDAMLKAAQIAFDALRDGKKLGQSVPNQ